jgi:hypothetical protein
MILVKFLILCYQPSPHSCAQLPAIFKCVAETILFQRWQPSDNPVRTISLPKSIQFSAKPTHKFYTDNVHYTG